MLYPPEVAGANTYLTPDLLTGRSPPILFYSLRSHHARCLTYLLSIDQVPLWIVLKTCVMRRLLVPFGLTVHVITSL